MDDDRPGDLELLLADARPLDRHGADRERPQPHGRDVSFPLEGKVVRRRIVDPVFYDKEGSAAECLMPVHFETALQTARGTAGSRRRAPRNHQPRHDRSARTSERRRVHGRGQGCAGTRPADRAAQQRRLGRCQGVVALDRSMAHPLPAGKNGGSSPPPAPGAGTDPFASPSMSPTCARSSGSKATMRARRAAQGLLARSPRPRTMSRERCGACVSPRSPPSSTSSARSRMSSTSMCSAPMRTYAWEWLIVNGRATAAIRPFGRQPVPAV